MALATFAVLPQAGWGVQAPASPKRVFICLDPVGPQAALDLAGDRKFFGDAFAAHGLVDGRDIVITVMRRKSWTGPDFAAAVDQGLDAGADVVLAHLYGPAAKKLLLPRMRGVPLVLWGADAGLEDSLEALNRRGENLTGVMYSFLELVGKRFELIKELRPGSKRAAVVFPPPPAPQPEWGVQETRRAHARYAEHARRLGMEYAFIELPEDVSGPAMARALQDAGIDVAEIGSVWRGPEIWKALAEQGIAASGVGAQSAKDGALLGGWSTGFVAGAVRLAALVVRGRPAASIPVERPRQWGVAINLSTARRLGIRVPDSVRVRVDQVFE